MGLFGVDKLISEVEARSGKSGPSLMQKEVPLEEIVKEHTRLFGSRSPSPSRGRRRKRTPPPRKESSKRHQFESRWPLSNRDQSGADRYGSENCRERLGRKGARRRGSFERGGSSGSPVATNKGASLPPVPRCAAEARALSAYYQVYHQEMGKRNTRTPSPCQIYGAPYHTPYGTGHYSSATDSASQRPNRSPRNSSQRLVASTVRKKVYVPAPKGDQNDDLCVVGEIVSQSGSKPARKYLARRAMEEGGDLIIVSSSEGEIEDSAFDDNR